MKLRKIFLPLLTLGLAFGVVACNSNSTIGTSGKKATSSSTQKIPSIKVSAAESKTTLGFGETVQLSAKDGNNNLEGVTWTSSDATVAAVNDTGLVTATNKAGTATITATKDGYTEGKISITVKKPEVVVQIESGTSDGGVITFKDSHNVDTDMVDQWPQNAVLILNFNASTAGAYELHVFCRAHGGYQSENTDVVNQTMEITVNSSPVTLSGSVTGGTFTDYTIGEANLVAGPNVMTVKSLAADNEICTIDLFTFVLKQNLIDN